MEYCQLSCAVVLLVAFFARSLSAQQPVAWHDPSPHTIQFVTVDKKVKLEVLDWGGSGRSVVLLAGLGSTAHTFDEFAPKLTPEYHVYGITRRGYGASSVPVSGYSADRLGDDVLTVLDALKIERPVLIGHSIAGEELSSIGTRYPGRIAGLIYLEAAYEWAYYDPSLGNFYVDLSELQNKLEQLRSTNRMTDQKPLIQEVMQTTLPRFEKDLKNQQELPPETVLPEPTPADLESYEALRAWENHIYGEAETEADLRQTHEPAPGNHVGPEKPTDAQEFAIRSGQQKYTDIRVPILAIFAFPRDLGPFVNSHPTALVAFQPSEIVAAAEVNAFKAGVPSARVVRIAHASHSVFITNEADVLRETRAFIAGLQ
jgi:non-heme chloroperoxidase